MAKLPIIGQKFDPKIMIDMGQNYQRYTSMWIIYGKYYSCKKPTKSEEWNLIYGQIGQNWEKIWSFDL